MGSTGRVSRGPPFRPIATIGGGGRSPARKSIRCTGSDGWAPTDSQYLQEQGIMELVTTDRTISRQCMLSLIVSASANMNWIFVKFKG